MSIELSLRFGIMIYCYSFGLAKLFTLDINECSEQSGLCPPPGTCINTMGSYKCICPRGFHTDPTGTMCLDADECTDDSRCQHGCQVIH